MTILVALAADNDSDECHKTSHDELFTSLVIVNRGNLLDKAVADSSLTG